ncbi:hypothetical protein NDGK_02037 [Clostridiales bacterium CHKCI001]|nr:hypothetical protein NDGK_02037 [Clostridiales bacterium CHKCI001]
MILKALNTLQEDLGEEIEDFFFSYKAFIRPENINGAYEVFEFNLISIKRLMAGFPDVGIMLNRGWMITKFFDEQDVIKKIICICKEDNHNNTYLKIGTYLRIQRN